MVGAREDGADDEGCRARAALLGAYQLGRTLGEGSFGKVKHARRRATGEHFAVKILERSKVLSLRGADDQVRREIAALTMLKHPNVVRLHEVAASKTKIYMVLEFVNGGELFDRIAMKKKLSEQEGRRLFQQLIDGVSYCHGKGVYHRDLKPENVLVDRKGNIKISDFGLSALPQHLGGDGLLHTTCGSPNYIAPEVLQNRGYDGSLSDIWSCGVILYIMLVGYLPFDDRNMVVLYQKVAASKTKIYMVLEFVNGGELFDRIAMKRKLPEPEGRMLFQQLIDGVSYCHGKGVYHRDLKPENVLVDKKGNIKISDFGLSALPQQLGGDGLLHTTCGSPNYIAPEVLQNRGYDGSLSDIWSCGVILYIMLVGYLPFDDRNMVVLYQKIFKGDAHIPEWLSPGAQDLLRRILKPDPKKRINMAEIKTHEWFQKDYIPVAPYDDNDEDVQLGAILPVKEKQISEAPGDKSIYQMNAFELIGMSSSLDLSSLFEEEEVSQRKIRFTSVLPPKYLFDKMESSATVSGFQVQRVHSKLKIMRNCNRLNNPTPFLVCAEVFELGPSLYVVELKKSHGDTALYRQLCDRISSDLGIRNIFRTEPLFREHLPSFDSSRDASGCLVTSVVHHTDMML